MFNSIRASHVLPFVQPKTAANRAQAEGHQHEDHFFWNCKECKSPVPVSKQGFQHLSNRRTSYVLCGGCAPQGPGGPVRTMGRVAA